MPRTSVKLLCWFAILALCHPIGHERMPERARPIEMPQMHQTDDAAPRYVRAQPIHR